MADRRRDPREDDRIYEDQWRSRQNFTHFATPNYDRLGYYPYGIDENRPAYDESEYEMVVYPSTYRSDVKPTEKRYFGMGPLGYRRSEERVHEDVCELLKFNDDVNASDIEVELENYEVTLKGTVGDREQKKLAEELAESVWGVQDVHNRLRISKGQESESEIKGG